MEEVYLPLGDHFNISEKFKFSDAFSELSQGLAKTKISIDTPMTKSALCRIMGIDRAKLQEFERNCKLVQILLINV